MEDKIFGLEENEQKQQEILTMIVELDKIMFPKKVKKTNSGEFAIASFEIIKKGENCNRLYKNKIKIKGSFCMLEPLANYKVKCRLAEHDERWGDTYELIYANRLIDMSDKNKQRQFLRCVLPEKTIDNMFEVYDDVVTLLANKEIEALCEIKGVSTKRAVKLCEIYEDSKDYGEVYAELGHIGMSIELIKKLVEYYKSPDTVIDIVKSNPYSLVNVDGIGFKKADDIAERVGVKGSNPNRIKGCILYILNENGKNGISFLHYQLLMNKLSEMIGYIEADLINKVCVDLVRSKEVVVTGEYVGIKKYYDIEVGIYYELMRILNADSMKEIEECLEGWENRVGKCEEEQGFTFTDEQRQAIEQAIKNNILVITGSAGTGKSSVAKGFLSAFGDSALKTCCALSGKASVRIKEATGFDSSTIHKALGSGIEGFIHNSENPMGSLIYLIDEGTMVNGELFLSFLKAVPTGARLYIMGDIQQLTPIGSCQVFADMLSSGAIPTVRLTKPHRQAMEGGIIPTSMKIAKQEQLFDSTFTGQMLLGDSIKDMLIDIYDEVPNKAERVAKHFIQLYKEKANYNIMDVQIVSMCKKGEIGVYNINNIIQSIVNPLRAKDNKITKKLDRENTYIIQKNDKVINMVNNYGLYRDSEDHEKVDISNGDIGIVKEIDDKGGCIVSFEGIGDVILTKKDTKNLELAYSCTCHKCLPKDTYIYTSDGIKQLGDLNNRANVGEFRPYEGNIGVYNGQYLETPSHFYNNGIDKCLDFKTSRGYALTTTLDHRLDVINENGELETKNSANIKIGDQLLLRKGQNIYGNNIDLVFEEPKVDTRAVKYNNPKYLTREFSELLGLIVGDGTVNKGGVKLFKEQEEVVKRFVYLINEVFGYEGHYKQSTNGKGFLCEINSVYISSILSQINGLSPNNKDIPDIILKTTKVNQCAFIRGLFEDGSVNVKNTKFDHIEFTTIYKSIFDKLKLMLLNIGIVTSNRFIPNEFKGIYAIYIYKYEARIYMKDIGFIGVRKNEKGNKCFIDERTTSCKSFRNITKIIKPIFNANKQYLSKDIRNNIGKSINRNRITTNMFNRFYKECCESNIIDENLTRLKNIIDNYYLDEITSVEETISETYCLTMPETHRFVQNGIQGWNCQGSGFKYVVVAVDFSAFKLLNVEILYTAITRAKKFCILTGVRKAIIMAINNREMNNKLTYLGKFLSGELPVPEKPKQIKNNTN